MSSLLSPIGEHRRTHVKPSKGKRAAKREKKMAMKLDGAEDSAKLPTPRSLELSASVDIGFNSIIKNLGSLSKPYDATEVSPKDYSMVFVARGSQSPAFNHHFPQMIAAASRNLPEKEKIRLVGFSKPCSERIGNTLGIPRVSSIAISRHAPGAEALLAVVENLVAPVDSPWLAEVPNTEYKTTQIASVETTIGTKRVK
jgi:ribonuclease P/MRP protein subunit POP3